MHLLTTAPVRLSLGPANVVVSCHQCGTSAASPAIDSSELRLTTDREGRQVGQHRSHIVAAVTSACLIARAAASGSQGRVQLSLALVVVFAAYLAELYTNPAVFLYAAGCGLLAGPRVASSIAQASPRLARRAGQ